MWAMSKGKEMKRIEEREIKGVKRSEDEDGE